MCWYFVVSTWPQILYYYIIVVANVGAFPSEKGNILFSFISCKSTKFLEFIWKRFLQISSLLLFCFKANYSVNMKLALKYWLRCSPVFWPRSGSWSQFCASQAGPRGWSGPHPVTLIAQLLVLKTYSTGEALSPTAPPNTPLTCSTWR